MLTKSERKLIQRERSYRIERRVFTLLSVLFALPFVVGAALLTISVFKLHNLQAYLYAAREGDWNSLLPGLSILLVFASLAYRADSKLTLIGYLKRQLTTEPNEPDTAPNGSSPAQVDDSNASIGSPSLSRSL